MLSSGFVSSLPAIFPLPATPAQPCWGCRDVSRGWRLNLIRTSNFSLSDLSFCMSGLIKPWLKVPVACFPWSPSETVFLILPVTLALKNWVTVRALWAFSSYDIFSRPPLTPATFSAEYLSASSVNREFQRRYRHLIFFFSTNINQIISMWSSPWKFFCLGHCFRWLRQGRKIHWFFYLWVFTE